MSYNNNKYKYHVYSFPVIESSHSKPDFTLPLMLIICASIPVDGYKKAFKLNWIDESNPWYIDETDLNHCLHAHKAQFIASFNTLTEITKEFPEYLI
jgi:hypothetical protein